MQALAKELVKYLIVAGLVMYLILGVIKPMVTELKNAGAPTLSAEGPRFEGGESLETMANEQGEIVTIGGRKKAHSYEEDLQLVKDMARQEPKIVANVVKDWVNKE